MCIMSSTLMDLLVDKLSPFSSKMKGESLKLSGSSYLMSSSSSPAHQLFNLDLLNGLLRETIMNSETSHQVIPVKQPLGLTGNNSFSVFNSGKAFSYPLSSFAMDTYRCSRSSSESHFLSNKLISHFVNSVFDKSSEMNPSVKSSFVVKKASAPPVSEGKMAVSETAPSLTKRSEVTNKCTVPNTSTLNKELTIRKTKEIQKRSKKRRRRQKKQLLECSSSASVSDDEVDGVASSLTSCVCLVTDSTDFGCTVAVKHSLQVTPNILSSFTVSVDSATDDDDSEWEAYEAKQCSSNSIPNKKVNAKIQSSNLANKKVNTKIQSSNLATSKSQDFKCSKPVDCQKVTSFLSSFMVPVESCSDDESDWDSCETEILNGTPEFEFAGLLLTSLCTPQTLSFGTNYGIDKSGEDNETVKLRIHLEKVNKSWNEATRGIAVKPKLPSKVSFAADEALVKIFPVDIYERKGEWEIYATERLRFKRKIDELEKILSPCFNPEHRSKVFKKFHEPTL